MAQFTVWSGPAFGLAVTVMSAVSVHPLALVQMNEYTPAAVKPVIVVVGLVGLVMTAVPGFPVGAGVHVPVPVPAIVAEPPGSMAQFTVLSGPAFGLVTITVSNAGMEQVPRVYVTL
jgi:hypothetical protein